jgi:hypothetical protein
MCAIQEERGNLPELRSLFERLFEKRVAVVREWRQLNGTGTNPRADLH